MKRYQKGIDLLEPFTKKSDVENELLFYYLDLTMIREDEISKDGYRNVLFNALGHNKEKFCRKFNSNK